MERYGKRFAKAVGELRNDLASALTFLSFHHRLLRTTNGLERLFGEVKLRTRVVGIFPSETSAANLCTTDILRVTEEWVLKRYLGMEPLVAMNKASDGKN